MNRADELPTQACVLTPTGHGAIAAVGVRGEGAERLVRKLFRRMKGELPARLLAGQRYLGWLGDEVVLFVKDDGFEIHGHGGEQVVVYLLRQFERLGAQVAPWTAWLPTDVEGLAQRLLTQAPTARTAGILLDQWQGAWRDVEMTPARIERLRQLADVGRHLVTPWRVLLAGAPNVGKSSLVNALAGFERCVVHDQPGTTRDLVGTAIALEGWPIELIDSAGQRATSGVEEAGVELARQAMAEADLCVWVLAGDLAPSFPEETPSRVIYVLNKVDLAPGWDWGQVPGAYRVSAQSGFGLAEFAAALVAELVPFAPEPGEAVPLGVFAESPGMAIPGEAPGASLPGLE